MEQPLKIVLTGGPGGGKTTAAELLRREIGDRVVVVPEAATVLFSGGFPRYDDPASSCAIQRAIFTTQVGLEQTQALHYPGRALICDRGTVDGAAYWHDGPDAFFEAMGTSLQAELARYDAVLFFETAANGGYGIEGGNPVRVETQQEAVRLDARLRALWQQHPRCSVIDHERSFLTKVTNGIRWLERVLDADGLGKFVPNTGQFDPKAPEMS